MSKQYDVAAYIWPAYTGTERRAHPFWPEKMGEWQTVKNAVSKYSGHSWPRKPLWGYVDEADPYVMEMEIAAAADHGVNVFIYDWYWYDHRPFLEQCLDNGYLKAQNNDRVKFYLMWANHSVNNLLDIRLSQDLENVIWDGACDETEVRIIMRRVIDQYFSHPSYYKIDGCPVFMIYEMDNLIRGLGGVDNTRRMLDEFRNETVKAGFPGLHLQMTIWSERNVNLSGVDGGKVGPMREVVDVLGFDSMTHYQFVHFADINRDYADILLDVKKEWDRIDSQYRVPYFPHISIGWDNNPRFTGLRPGVVKNNTPQQVEAGFRMAKDYLQRHPDRTPLVTINSWNEWTETSYLEPDDLNGYGYLEAVKRVFLD